MSEFMAELIGTMVLIIFGCGVCAGVSLNKSFAKDSGWIVIIFGWGLGVMLAAYLVGHYSGAILNPALAIGLAVAGQLAWSKVPIFILAEVIGAFLGAVIVYLHYLPHWKATDDPSTKLGVFCTSPAIPSTFSNLISEMIGTFILVLLLLGFGAKEIGFGAGVKTMVVGYLIIAIGASLGGTTGYAINPARDFGPRLAHAVLPIAGKGSSNWGYAWVPIVGPIIGAVIAAAFYLVVFP
ncbi:glycerol uptake facilitator protein [Seinonella peptonophila]|uniref:Glycerol uptake facilitator protein n=1 Tax=Seinonella peptonophila TaxID=112248 RepID=A0A1M5BN08_9BACL|nr:glycerol uptake facilitator protein [Seinonella peptonophila]